MKQVLFDSDVLLDVLLNRHPFVIDSAQALNTVATERVKGYLAGHAVTNLYYIMRRQLSSSVAHEKLKLLLQRIQVANITDSVIRAALQSPMTDFEDTVTSEAAHAAQIGLIVTRNISDFEKSSGCIPLLQVPTSFPRKWESIREADVRCRFPSARE